MNERLLIDTCALIWLANKSDSLSLVARLKILPFDYKLWMRSTQLPKYHRDPADRTIMALRA